MGLRRWPALPCFKVLPAGTHEVPVPPRAHAVALADEDDEASGEVSTLPPPTTDEPSAANEMSSVGVAALIVGMCVLAVVVIAIACETPRRTDAERQLLNYAGVVNPIFAPLGEDSDSSSDETAVVARGKWPAQAQEREAGATTV